MKLRFLTTVCFALALAVSACSGSAVPTIPTAQPTDTASPATATAVPPTDTTVPPSPTAVPTAAPTTVPAPTNTAAAKPASSALGAGDLAPVAAAMAAVKSYRITLTSTSPIEGASGTFVLEVVKPDRLHTKADMGAGKTFESISIGGDTYLKIGDKWLKSPAKIPMSPIIMSGDPQTILNLMNSSDKKVNITKGAATQVDGTPCQEWLVTPPATATETTGGSICIGLTNNLPLQFKSNDGKFVAKYSDWNAPIKIEAPAV